MEKQSPINILEQCHYGKNYDRLKFSILLNELTQSQFNEFCDQVLQQANFCNPNSMANRSDEFENKIKHYNERDSHC